MDIDNFHYNVFVGSMIVYAKPKPICLTPCYRLTGVEIDPSEETVVDLEILQSENIISHIAISSLETYLRKGADHMVRTK